MIVYLKGDATIPCKRPAIITHVCNDVGAWGAGFVLAVSNRWKQPEAEYRAWMTCALGLTQFVDCESGIVVANMVAQRGLTGPRPWIRYQALGLCLTDVGHRARSTNASVHMPRIGCGIAGGRWEEVEPIILEALTDIDVFVYDLA